MIQSEHQLLDRNEVPQIIGFHPETIARASTAGKLPAHYLGRRIVRYRKEDVLRWLEGFRYITPPATAEV